MTQTFDWSLVQSFLAALDQGSLLGAARVLNSSQPTVGRHIAELESQLGVVLFERTGRGLLPTARRCGWPNRPAPWRPARTNWRAAYRAPRRA